MSPLTDYFRDYGILPTLKVPGPYPVRASYPWYHVIGQYLGTILLAGIGTGMVLLLGLYSEFPTNILGPLVSIAVTICFVYLATRHAFLWVELNGTIIQAQHMYSRRVIAHSISDITDLLTVVFLARRLETRIAEAWVGRVRGVMIRFRGNKHSILICRADPCMNNAQELIEAIVYEMSKVGPIDFETIDFEGKPLVRRIYWK